MKIQILYLSDLHIKDENTLSNTRVMSIVESMRCLEKFDKLLIVISGDIAYSGKMLEYKIAEKKLDLLIRKVKEVFSIDDQGVRVVFVPGNHDNDYKDIPYCIEDIASVNDREVNCWVEKEKLQNFYSFSKKFNCFCLNPYMEIKCIDFNGFTIQVILLNSAIYSAFRDKTKNNGKGLHYIQRKAMDNIEKFTKKADFTILVSHHSPEWFDDDSKHILEEYIDRNVSIAFWGHEHYEKIYKYGAQIIKGGVLSGEGAKSNFYSILIDNSETNAKIFYANYDERKGVYLLKENETFVLRNKQYIYPLQSYVEENINQYISSLRCRLSDIFVFPRLNFNSNFFDVEKELVSLNDTLEEINKHPFIVVSGGDLSGKTSLLKILYLEYSKRGKTPILFVPETLKNIDIDKLIKYNFYEQYGEDETLYQQYLMQDKTYRVLLIDDVHLISTSKLFDKFINRAKEFFCQIIISTGEEKFNILESLQKEREKENAKVTISPFYIDKRKELIGKIIDVTDAYLSCEKEFYIETINVSIQNQLRYFSLNPQFIIFYTNSFIQKVISADGNSNVFGAVFQANITSMLKGIKGISVPRVSQILQNIASCIHLTKSYPISLSVLVGIIEEFNKNHERGMNANDLVVALEKIGMIKILVDDTVIFSSKNYLAYFVAMYLNGKLGTSEGNEQIILLLKNLCFGINSDILLFLSYLTNRLEIIELILSESENYLRDWIENNLDQRNLKCLFVDFNAPKIMFPTSSEKAERTKDIVKYEKEIIQSERIQTTDIYDYDLNDIDKYVNKQNKVLKLLEIISKILPNFEHMLDKNEMDRIIKHIFSIPNKLTFYMFKPFDENFEETIKEVVELYNENRPEEKQLNQAQGVLFLQDWMTAVILWLYDVSTRMATTEETYEVLLDSKHGESMANRIQQCLVLYQRDDYERLGKMLEKIYDETNSQSIKFMVMKIARNYLIKHDVPYVGYGQRFIDKFFPDKHGIAERKKLKVG